MNRSNLTQSNVSSKLTTATHGLSELQDVERKAHLVDAVCAAVLLICEVIAGLAWRDAGAVLLRRVAEAREETDDRRRDAALCT